MLEAFVMGSLCVAMVLYLLNGAAEYRAARKNLRAETDACEREADEPHASKRE